LLSLMDDSLTRLDAYIDSLRDYYLLRRGELLLSDIDFHALFEDIGQFYKMYTQNNDVVFAIDVVQHTTFKSDKAVLELILHNLLSNAFKYQRRDADNKSVSLSVNVMNDKATIVVKDTGIGIASEHKNDIFKLFFRGSDQAKGMGFGLYNVQSALLKLQGSIEVKSQLGVGTTFEVVIPIKARSICFKRVVFDPIKTLTVHLKPQVWNSAQLFFFVQHKLRTPVVLFYQAPLRSKVC